MFDFKLVLPPSKPNTTQRKIQLQIGESDPTDRELHPTENELGMFSGQAGVEVSGQLVDIDASGKPEPAKEFVFVLYDTVVPDSPDQVGLVVTEEYEDELDSPSE